MAMHVYWQGFDIYVHDSVLGNAVVRIKDDLHKTMTYIPKFHRLSLSSYPSIVSHWLLTNLWWPIVEHLMSVKETCVLLVLHLSAHVWLL